MKRVVVATTDGSLDAAMELAVQLRDAGAEVIWQGRAAPSSVVAASVQEAADEVFVVGTDAAAVRAGLAAAGAEEIAVHERGSKV